MNFIDRKMIKSPLYGEIQYKFRVYLQRKFKFDFWHLISMYEKKYLSEIYEVLELRQNDFAKTPIVEVGCGLGDIIGNLQLNGRKYGYDKSEEVIKAASLLHSDTIFNVGSFEDIDIEGEIGCLIMVNFIHEISSENLKEYLSRLMKKNKLNYILFDSVNRIKHSEYMFTHNGSALLGMEYVCEYIGKNYFGSHGAYRHIELWKYCG